MACAFLISATDIAKRITQAWGRNWIVSRKSALVGADTSSLEEEWIRIWQAARKHFHRAAAVFPAGLIKDQTCVKDARIQIAHGSFFFPPREPGALTRLGKVLNADFDRRREPGVLTRLGKVLAVVSVIAR